MRAACMQRDEPPPRRGRAETVGCARFQAFAPVSPRTPWLCTRTSRRWSSQRTKSATRSVLSQPRPLSVRQVKELAHTIDAAYKGVSNLMVVAILKGAFIFCSDLVVRLSAPPAPRS